MELLTLIQLWMESDDHLAVYLGMFWIPIFICRYFQIIFVISMHCFADKMSKISAEENRRR